jgi:hypothetical protein
MAITDSTEWLIGSRRRGSAWPPLYAKELAMSDELLELAARCERGQLKALSIKQPYPHHIFNSGKDVENRDWLTKGRGWVIVHAGKSKSEIDREFDPPDLPVGGVVGMMKIVDCVTQMASEWFFGRYGFVIGESFPLPLIPCNGALGFFKLGDDVNAAVAAALRSKYKGGE